MGGFRVATDSAWVESGLSVARTPWAPPPRATAVITYHSNTSPAYDYEVITVSHGIVEKRYGGDLDYLPTQRNDDLKPSRENLSVIYDRYKYPIIANADGWQTVGMANPDEVHGCHIKTGIILHDFEAPGNKWGTDCIGWRADRTWGTYSCRWGDTAADVLADGVVTTFGGLGPLVVKDGIEEDLEANPQWGNWNTTDAARQFLGVNAGGDLLVITVTGGDGEGGGGIHGNEQAAVCARHGAVDAIMLDGGGSAQVMLNGVMTHPSSDGGGARQVAGFLCIDAAIVP